MEADQRAGGVRGIYFQKARRFDVLGATLLAQRDAWRELRGGGKPVATIHNLSPVFSAANTLPADKMRERVEEMSWHVWMRADRDGVLELPGRAPREVPDLREACDLVGFSYYSATGIGAEGEIVPYPPNERVGPMGYAPWSEGLGAGAAAAARGAARAGRC